MGSCLEGIFKRNPQTPEGITQLNQSFLDEGLLPVSIRSRHDQSFLYYVKFSELETRINDMLQTQENLQQSQQILKELTNQLNEYIRSIDDPKSQRCRRLQQIQMELKSDKDKGYVCIELVHLRLSDSNKSQITVQIVGSEGKILQSVKGSLLKYQTKRPKTKSKVYSLDKVIQLYGNFKGVIVLRVAGESCCTSIPMLDIQQQMAIAQVFNLRNPEMMEAVGQVSVRVEIIKNVQQWKAKTRRMLNSRVRQLDKMILEAKTGASRPGKVMIRSSLSERNTLTQFSYYQQLN